MVIQILFDNPDSWIAPYARELAEQIALMGHDVRVLTDARDVAQGDILALLSCENLFGDLHLNKHNLVVHESDLPKGKGWSPVTWQVLDGKNEIPITLFEAVASVDAGPIYEQAIMILEGHELLTEIKRKQGAITQQLILNFVRNYPKNASRKQVGESTYYTKRGPGDSKLDINKSIADQFNLLRVCDNERYPAFIVKDGRKYIIRIEKV